MEKEQELDFNGFIRMKEKRRLSRSKGKRTYEKTKLHSVKAKKRDAKIIHYNPNSDEDFDNEYE